MSVDSVLKIVHQGTGLAVDSPVTGALQNNSAVEPANDALLIGRDGRERLIDCSVAPIRDTFGAVEGAVLVLLDVTQQRKSEQVRRQREALFHLLVEATVDYAIFLLDRSGTVVSWNRGAERIKGYKADEIIGQHFSRFYPQEANDSGWPYEELTIAAADGRFEDEGWRLRKDGSRFWANVIITALRTETGELRGFSKITRDLTDRRNVEVALRDSEERFRLLVETTSDYAIFMLDDKGNVTTWNTGAERIKGYKAEEIIGKHFSCFYPSEALDRRWPEKALEVATAVGRFEDVGWRVRKDGTQFWANVVITALRDESGALRGFSKITRDLTERHQLERAKLQAELMADLNRRKTSSWRCSRTSCETRWRRFSTPSIYCACRSAKILFSSRRGRSSRARSRT